ncbi:prolipoprotein diacylglyceryl transferase 1 [Microtetraspora sp. NBRC 13810]|uniref:prolipoprotein diacylglyceryl transferase n=1 Tax=Microtetraspora sp. NBRC 13810 TaxID=3030990 RepID=UPI0024A4EC9D|nr:prolipoprotein diacylglyceryl transferase [Microtetraspora sp. NBRC 13810]GLW12235.1 prolipoprotein diacylglyceryl transferase 1 [Microtetraspora sp. NBRC 13810]
MPLASIPSPSEGVWYLGPIPLRAYALCIMLGVVVAVWLGERRWRARGGAPGTIVDLAVWAVPFGLVGGRLYHVITDWQLYFGPQAPNEPIEALFIWNGGLGIWGAVALGGVGVWIGCRRRGISLSAMADTLAPCIVLAQGIGRWGNYFNQELFGSPTDLPWGLEIDPSRPGTVPGEDTYHPTFLYESIWDVALAFALIWIGRRFAFRHGRLFALYVAGYTFGRFWIEGLRVDPVGGVDHAVDFLGLRLNQWTAIVLFIGALVYFWATRNKTTEESLGVVVPEPRDDAPVEAEAVDPAHTADMSDDEQTAEPGDPEEPADEPTGKPAEKPEKTGAAGESAEKAETAGDPGKSADESAEKAETAGEPADGPGVKAANASAGGPADDPAHPADQADEGEAVLAAGEGEAGKK